MSNKPESKKCPNCGACQECGAGGRPQIVPMPYPVYPQRPWYGPYWYSQPNTWSGTTSYTQTWNNNAGGQLQ